MASTGDEPFIPQDILFNVLKWLPTKSIVRFQSVCNGWKNLFNTPRFIAEHARINTNEHENPLLLLIEHDSFGKGTPPSLRLVNHNMESIAVMRNPSFLFLEEIGLSDKKEKKLVGKYIIIGSCKGLLLIEIYDDNYNPSSLFLMNPTIGEVREIAYPTNEVYSGSCKYGLGFSSIVDDYKIVRFYNIELSNKKIKKKNRKRALNGHDGVEVFSLSTSSWTEVELGALENTTIISSAVSTDGTILWLGVRNSFNVVVSFDIATEVFTYTPIKLPVKNCRPDSTTTLGLYRKKLFVFEHYNGGNSFNSINSWEIEDVASESGKSFSCSEAYNFGNISWFFSSLCIWRNEIVCLDEDFHSTDPKSKFLLRLFNITTKEWKEFLNFFLCDSYRCQGCSYEMSFVSVWKNNIE